MDKIKNNYGTTNREINRGFNDGEPKKGEELLDDGPHNTTFDWFSDEEGGFAGRPKGGER